jgi:hypothetical protein
MTLHRVWIATSSDGLIRADQVIGIGSHETPRIPGKSPHWLLVVNLAVTAGSGDRVGWDVGILDRTLCQTSGPQPNAPAELARLLARLDGADAAGIVAAELVRGVDGNNTHRGQIRFGFTPFAGVEAVPTATGPDDYL